MKVFLGGTCHNSDWREKLIPLLKGLNVKEYSKLKKYPLHRDINPENTLWKNKKLVGIIDFDISNK